MNTIAPFIRCNRRSGFSLFEVVLAVGILSISILALLGLFGPTMSSVRDVVDSNEANGVRTRLNAALMSDEIYNELGLTGNANPYRSFAAMLTDPTSGGRTPKYLYFWAERQDVNQPLVLEYSDNLGAFSQSKLDVVEGNAFVVALERGMQGGTKKYDFNDIDQQGYFPILVSIYAVPATDLLNRSEADFDAMVSKVDPVFTYTAAKLR